MVTVIVVCGGYCCAIWVQHTSAKSGGELVTLFGGYFYDGLNDAIGVHHTSAKSWGELVTLLSDRRILMPSLSWCFIFVLHEEHRKYHEYPEWQNI